ncbi:uncharacterized protein LOC111903349 [Lactuca sativa]|uniref:uncharacterized protein LOC111903349 n=1 Tax=Lactuca sativa TaxID=4236 RepID=UPI000CD8D216|nr:uncharacterized protein LOC111903349 [Lactuca sativa]
MVLETGRGLNQENSLVQAEDTRWGSYFKIVTSLMNLFLKVLNILTYVEDEGSILSNQNQAFGILRYFKTLDFVFYLHLMYGILHLTNVLSKHLQKKDQDILEATYLVRGTMEVLKSLRDMGFAKLLSNVFSFCQKHNINIVEMMLFQKKIVEMTENYVTLRGRNTKVTNQFHFEVEIFRTVMDMQIIEFGDRFSELSTQLIEYMVALSHCDSFAKFDKTKLLKLSELYTKAFDDAENM